MFGYRVIANDALFETKTREVVRSMKERCFSLPFHPFKKTKIESYRQPMQDVFIDEINKIIYCHQSIKAEIEKRIPFQMMTRFDIPMRHNFGGIFGASST